MLHKMVSVFINSSCSFINNFILWCEMQPFHYYSNKGLTGEKFTDNVKLTNPENPRFGAYKRN